MSGRHAERTQHSASGRTALMIWGHTGIAATVHPHGDLYRYPASRAVPTSRAPAVRAPGGPHRTSRRISGTATMSTRGLTTRDNTPREYQTKCVSAPQSKPQKWVADERNVQPSERARIKQHPVGHRRFIPNCYRRSGRAGAGNGNGESGVRQMVETTKIHT